MLEYARSTSEDSRESLIMNHLPQVRWIASSICERLPSDVMHEDLVSAGILGLIAAVDNYDPAHNTTLRTYAEYRIRGAILDSLRGLDGVPPHRRKQSRQIQAAILAAEQRLGRTPLEDEIASQLGLSLEDYREALLSVRGVTLGTLESIEKDRSLLHYLAGDEESPGSLLERAELQKLLADAIRRMSAVERKVIHLYFMEELTLSEIGKVLSLHTSRISQLKSQAILRLRAYVSKRWPGGG